MRNPTPPCKIMGISFLLFLSMGCSALPTYKVMVNGYLGPKAETPFKAGAAFHILERKASVNPLLDKKLVEKIRLLLEQTGFKVSSLEEADYLVRFRYLGGVQQRLETFYEPGFWYPPLYAHYYWHYPAWGWSLGGGYVAYAKTEHLHRLFLYVFGADRFREDGSEKMTWIGEATTRSASPDLRTALRYMVAALFNHFGEDTRKGIFIKVKGDDPRVVLISPKSE